MQDSTPQPILKIAVPVPLAGLFDYLPPEGGSAPGPGVRVVVQFGQRRLVGVVVRHATHSEVENSRLQSVRRVLDGGQPLFDDRLLGLLEWCWRYYKHAPGEVLFNAIPPVLRKAAGKRPGPAVAYRLTPSGRERLERGPERAPAQWGLLDQLARGPLGADDLRRWRDDWRALLRKVMERDWIAEVAAVAPGLNVTPGPTLNEEQAAALENIRADLGRFRCHLLDGVTGSGKTEVYLGLIEHVVGAGGQVLVLVPEIGLTAQLVGRMRRRLGIEPAVYHSALADGERARVWQQAASGASPLFLGTRSALFLPLQRPGLFIMDESHDPSFKQQDGFRFSARDVAVKRASLLRIPVVLGTATPTLETLYNAASGRYAWNRLRTRATGAGQPGWRVLDLKQQPVSAGISGRVLEAVEETLQRGEQVLIFLNRRGYAPVLLCHDCGWHAACHRCDANMTWHRAERHLICHHCGHSAAVPQFCPDCRADALQGAGAGTEQLEQFLAERFESIPLYRFDRDMTRRKGAFDKMVRKVRAGEPAIMVGTQMLAKGHHFPKVTLAVIVNLDQALYSADFRALERMGQIMMQVAGRSGRADQPGQVVLQTHHPDHPILERLFRDGYERFAMQLLEDRRVSALPPFTAQATLRAEANSREAVQGFLAEARSVFHSLATEIHGPYPALMERRGGRVRWYLLLQDKKRNSLQASLDRWLDRLRPLPSARQVRWAVDVDPQEF